jgi:hypothetical protein
VRVVRVEPLGNVVVMGMGVIVMHRVHSARHQADG